MVDQEFSFLEKVENLLPGMKKLFELLNLTKRQAVSRAQAEQLKFSREVRNQFMQLKEKGLAIPVFTL
jgi:hypothetical protein